MTCGGEDLSIEAVQPRSNMVTREILFCTVYCPELPGKKSGGEKKKKKERKCLVYLFIMQLYICRPVAARGTWEGG